jgi:hypothetical protein
LAQVRPISGRDDSAAGAEERLLLWLTVTICLSHWRPE